MILQWMTTRHASTRTREGTDTIMFDCMRCGIAVVFTSIDSVVTTATTGRSFDQLLSIDHADFQPLTFNRPAILIVDCTRDFL